MGKVLEEWKEGSVSVAVEAGKDDMCSEGTHVHVYKNGRRTKTWISLTQTKGNDLDSKDVKIAEKLLEQNYSDIDSLCNDVKDGKYDS